MSEGLVGLERPHKLTVTRVELVWDGSGGLEHELTYDIEHHPECLDEEGNPEQCLITWTLGGSTLEENLEGSGTPVTEAGTYQIEGWWENYGDGDGYGTYGTETGIRLVREKEKTP